jgi:hypothetical protein
MVQFAFIIRVNSQHINAPQCIQFVMITVLLYEFIPCKSAMVIHNEEDCIQCAVLVNSIHKDNDDDVFCRVVTDLTLERISNQEVMVATKNRAQVFLFLRTVVISVEDIGELTSKRFSSLVYY